jgi:hypothetical protein
MPELMIALLLWVAGQRHETPLTTAPGALDTIPESLPYVLYETTWGA